jgi:hypothetical protein
MRKKKVEQEIKEKEEKFAYLQTRQDRRNVKYSIAKKKRQLKKEMEKSAS